MGTKRPSWTLFDISSNPKPADRSHQQPGRISRDTSPRPGTTAQSERERIREEEWRREREKERMKDKMRNKGKAVEPLERYSEREMVPAPRAREGERERRDRDRRYEHERVGNGRPMSNLESGTVKAMDRAGEKGGTFPRTRKDSRECANRMSPVREKSMERRGNELGGRKKRMDDDWGREGERGKAWRPETQEDRERYRESDALRNRAKEDGKTNRGRVMEDGTAPQRERPRGSDPGFRERRREKDSEVSDLRDNRGGYMARERERDRFRERDGRMPSPRRRRDGDVSSNRGAWEMPARRGGQRDTKSEGDSDGGTEKGRVKEREEQRYHHSRSEGDDKGQMAREKGREEHRHRDQERQRHRERNRHREADRPKPREEDRAERAEKEREFYRERDRRKEKGFEEGKRWKDGSRDIEGSRAADRQRPSDSRGGERYRERIDDERRCRERKADPRWYDATGGGDRPLGDAVATAPLQGQSSGEWSSDIDIEKRLRWKRDSYEDRESGRESTAESDQDVERDWRGGRAAEKSCGEQRTSEKPKSGGDRGQERAGSMPEQRRMWLEPQRRTCSKESSLEEEFTERERHTRRKDRKSGGEGRTDSGENAGKDGQRENEEQDRQQFAQTQSRANHYEMDRYRKRDGYIEQDVDPESVEVGVGVDAEEVNDARGEGDNEGHEPLSDSDGGRERNRQRYMKQDNAMDGREQGGGRDSWTRSESEGGSDQGRDAVVSGEDGFITVSSGGEGEDEREEEEFEDCRDFWEGSHGHDAALPAGGCKKYGGEMERQEEEKEGNKDRSEEDGDGRRQEKDKQPKYVFCVIGHTLPRSKPGVISHLDQGEEVKSSNLKTGSCQPRSDEIPLQLLNDMHPVLSRNKEHPMNANQEAESRTDGAEKPLQREGSSNAPEKSKVDGTSQTSSEDREKEAEDEVPSKVEHPYAEIGPVGKDVETEKLLAEWRERNREHIEQSGSDVINPYGDVDLQVDSVPIPVALGEITHEGMTPEEEVSIRIRMSGAWSLEEEEKRHSQAPHLKWAKNVVREILGSSEEHAIDDPAPGESDRGPETDGHKAEVAEAMRDIPVYAVVRKSRSEDHNSGMELDEGRAERLEEQRGNGQNRADTHADQLTAMHGDTLARTHADTISDTEKEEVTANDSSSNQQVEKAEVDDRGSCPAADGVGETAGGIEIIAEKEKGREQEVEMYLSMSNTLYKPSSCPSLSYESESADAMGRGEVEMMGESEDEQGERRGEAEEGSSDSEGSEEEGGGGGRGGGGEGVGGGGGGGGGGSVKSSCSFRDLGPEARIRRRGIRKTTERRKESLVEEEEEEGVGRDRRTRIFAIADDEPASESWGEVELRKVLGTIGRRRRNSKFFNAAQLYQQYSEEAQNIEILRQSRSDVISICEESPAPPRPSSPASLVPPACRPLPPIPSGFRPHSLSHVGSISGITTSAKHLPLPEPPKNRPPSPRLSIALGQSATLWQDLPAVRSSTELGELTEDQRRLQEVRFEVVTSEASYCRSLDIVVEHFVKSKQLGALLTTQDRNWLFSRLAEVRAISHSFLSKLEERVESDMLHFSVCEIIARHAPRFKMVYVPYLTNQSYQDATYQRLMNENLGFKRIVEKLERSPVCQRLPFRSFLILPFQRITRIKLLVQNIVKRTAPGTEEVMQAIKALKLLEKLIQESNDSISQMKSIESLVSLSAKVEFECRTLPLISQSRRLVREGPVNELMEFSLKDSERNVYLHLFNDYLLISLHKEGGRFTVIDHAPVSELRAENCRVKLHSLQKNLFRLHLSNKALLLRTDTQSDKLRWISAISRPHPEVDFSAAQDFTQMQCIRAFVAQQPDELSLEKADIILVHQQSSDGWVEGTRLADRHYGWMPESHLETITNSRVCKRNLLDALKLTTATAAV